MRRIEEYSNRRDDQVTGEDPETQAIDHHGSELPVVGLLLRLIGGLDTMRDEAKFIQNTEKFTFDVDLERILIHGRAGDVVAASDVIVMLLVLLLMMMVVTVCILGAVLSGYSAVLGIQRYRVVNVLDIGDETERWRIARLELAHLGLAQQELAGKIAAGARHAQDPRQPLAYYSLHLPKRRQRHHKL